MKIFFHDLREFLYFYRDQDPDPDQDPGSGSGSGLRKLPGSGSGLKRIWIRNTDKYRFKWKNIIVPMVGRYLPTIQRGTYPPIYLNLV